MNWTFADSCAVCGVTRMAHPAVATHGFVEPSAPDLDDLRPAPSWPGLKTGVLGMGSDEHRGRGRDISRAEARRDLLGSVGECLAEDLRSAPESKQWLEIERAERIRRLAEKLYREIVIRELDLRELRADDVTGGLDFSDMRRVAYEAAQTFYPPAEPGTTEKE